jgi:hypothetical protein
MADEQEPVNGDDSARIAVEVTLGKPPAVPDTPAMAECRRALTKEIAAIRAKGGVVEIPDA